MAPSTVEVNVPAACEIADVNMLLSIQHTWVGDLTVTLEGPGGTSEMFSAICGEHGRLARDAGRPVGGPSDHVVRRGHDERQRPDRERHGPELLQRQACRRRLDVADQRRGFGGDSGTLETWSLTFETQ